jgi:hypothetical protein
MHYARKRPILRHFSRRTARRFRSTRQKAVGSPSVIRVGIIARFPAPEWRGRSVRSSALV